MAASTEPPPTELAVLRSVLSRITPPKTQRELSDLPHIVASQIHSLKDCGSILSQSWTSQSGSAKGEAALVVHRLVTLISSLLLGRNPGERWAAAVLVKTVVETGGHEVLSKGKHWVTGLLTNLRKSDPSSSKAIYVLAVTRTFMRTWPYPSLVRELTTPNLPQFIKTCIANLGSASSGDKERRTILECLLKLITHHPTVFRTHANDLDSAIRLVVGDRGGSQTFVDLVTVPEETRRVALQLRTALHGCAPKQGSVASWEEGVSSIIAICHDFADRIFSPVASDARDRSNLNTNGSNAPLLTATVVEANLRQLELSLDTLVSYMLSDSATPVNIPVKALHDLASRLLNIVVSMDGKLPRFKDGTIREHKDLSSSAAIRLHNPALRLMHALISRAKSAGTALGPVLLNHVVWVFRNEKSSADIRAAVYALTAQILSDMGTVCGKRQVEKIADILRSCCDDILPKTAVSEATTLATKLTNGAKHSNNPGSDHSTATPAHVVMPSLQQSAMEVLELVLGGIPVVSFSDSLRLQLDRTAVLSGQQRLIVASVMNASKRKAGRPSLIPFLAQMDDAQGPVVEALLRPRAPVVQVLPSNEEHLDFGKAASFSINQTYEDVGRSGLKRSLEETAQPEDDEHDNSKRARSASPETTGDMQVDTNNDASMANVPTDEPAMQVDVDAGITMGAVDDEIAAEPPVDISSTLQAAEAEAAPEQTAPARSTSHVTQPLATSRPADDNEDSDDDDMVINLDLEDSDGDQ